MQKIISSPLQGYTDFHFRNAYHKYFEGVDEFMAPYIRLNKKEVKASNERDILPKNNLGIDLRPQIMTRDANEFLFLVEYLNTHNYKKLDWNLGCPYPMVAKRGMGSGLLPDPERIDEILSEVFTKSDIEVSVKMRLGYEDPNEIFKVLHVLEKHPLEHIGIHPRIAKQLYKGNVDLDTFEKCLGQSRHKIFYNGDVSTIQEYRKLKERFPSLGAWLIGRGLLMNPYLASMIKADTDIFPDDKLDVYRMFHATIFESYRQKLSGPKHIILKMYQFWEYFIYSFPESTKGLKKIKKARSISDYEHAVEEIFLHSERT